MIKRTLYFGNPAYLSCKNEQLMVRLPEVEKHDMLPETFKKDAQPSFPLKTFGVVILYNQQVTITQALMSNTNFTNRENLK